jgi:hypothetical protein
VLSHPTFRLERSPSLSLGAWLPNNLARRIFGGAMRARPDVADASASAAGCTGAGVWPARGAAIGAPGIGVVGLLAELAVGLQVLLVGFFGGGDRWPTFARSAAAAALVGSAAPAPLAKRRHVDPAASAALIF